MNKAKVIVIRRIFIGFALFALLAFIAAGCGGNRKHESTGEYIDDTVLTSKVKAAIFEDPDLKVLRINVETFKGVVQLSGFVISTQASAKAVEIARSVNGVRSVKNSMVVR